MSFIKCPRCELNYIEDSEGFCKICKREMQGENNSDDVELCTICNERPAIPGRDICLVCLKEMNASNEDDADEMERDDEQVSPVDENSIGSIDPVSSMDEIMPDINDDIPEGEFSEIENELSLDAMGDEEEQESEDEDEESE